MIKGIEIGCIIAGFPIRFIKQWNLSWCLSQGCRLTVELHELRLCHGRSNLVGSLSFQPVKGWS